MADLFGRNEPRIVTPMTADFGTINWGGPVTSAINVSISYAQPVTRRRTIGNRDAVIFAGQPAGQITISRIVTSDAKALFSAPGWNACNPGQLSITLGGCGGQGGNLTLTAHGCIVSQYQLQMEAEGLTVIDNVVIDCLFVSES